MTRWLKAFFARYAPQATTKPEVDSPPVEPPEPTPPAPPSLPSRKARLEEVFRGGGLDVVVDPYIADNMIVTRTEKKLFVYYLDRGELVAFDLPSIEPAPPYFDRRKAC